MRKYLFILVAVVLSAACASKADRPYTSMNVFIAGGDDPCLKVTFPDSVEYLSGYSMVNKDGEHITAYKLKMLHRESYDITVMKVYNETADSEWALVPLTDFYLPEEKLHERGVGELLPDRTAVIIYTEHDDGNLYLRGIVGEYTSRERAFFVTVDRMVFKADYRRMFKRDEWEKSKSGEFLINDMKSFTDWLFENTRVTECGGEALQKTLRN